jgi:hypothetical protein
MFLTKTLLFWRDTWAHNTLIYEMSPRVSISRSHLMNPGFRSDLDSLGLDDLKPRDKIGLSCDGSQHEGEQEMRTLTPGRNPFARSFSVGVGRTHTT